MPLPQSYIFKKILKILFSCLWKCIHRHNQKSETGLVNRCLCFCLPLPHLSHLPDSDCNPQGWSTQTQTQPQPTRSAASQTSSPRHRHWRALQHREGRRGCGAEWGRDKQIKSGIVLNLNWIICAPIRREDLRIDRGNENFHCVTDTFPSLDFIGHSALSSLNYPLYPNELSIETIKQTKQVPNREISNWMFLLV